MRSRRPGAIVLNNGVIEICIYPELGGKITSIRHLGNGQEWLYQGTSTPNPVKSSAPYDAIQAYGFDEMFPSINPDKSWRDHGEVWRHRWMVGEQSEHTLTTSFKSPGFPFEFIRTISLDSQHIDFSYTITHLSKREEYALWTPHPLFTFSGETRLILPDGPDSIIQAMDGGILGPYGTIHRISKQSELLLPGQLPDGLASKFYLNGPVSEGKCGLVDKRGRLMMRYPTDSVPYLGIWINNGGWWGHKNLALEPATSPMDSPSASERIGVPARWAAGEQRKWKISIEISINL